MSTSAQQATHVEPFDVVVVGGGQAGMAAAWHLGRHQLRYVVLEAAAELGHTWRTRWDSLRLFTPSEHDALPGLPFPAPAGTYPDKDAVADYLRDYAAAFDLPVEVNERVTGLQRTDAGFRLSTTDRTYTARQVVVATGPFQTPFVPPLAAALDDSVTQVHSVEYRNPEALPGGPALVVGGGNSGFQIAEELARTRPVELSVGAAYPALPQRLLGRDVFWWLTRLRLMRVTAGSRLGRRMQTRGEFLIGSSRRGLQRAGVRFRPRLVDAAGRTVRFADGTSREVDVVVWATGFRPDHSWIDIPGVLRDGRVPHRRGVTNVPGLYFLGLSWQHTRGSALLGFVADDAAHVARAAALYRDRDVVPTVGLHPRPRSRARLRWIRDGPRPGSGTERRGQERRSPMPGKEKPGKGRKLLAFPVYPGLTPLDLVGPLTVLRNLYGTPYRTVVVGERREQLDTDTALRVLPAATFAEVPQPFAVVVPGGGAATVAAMQDQALVGYVRSAAATAELVGATGNGALLLAAAGLLEGRRAAVHWAYAELLGSLGATVVRERWVEDGRFLTAAGGSAGIDMMLALLARWKSRSGAQLAQLFMEYDPEPPFGPLDPAGGDAGLAALLRTPRQRAGQAEQR